MSNTDTHKYAVLQGIVSNLQTQATHVHYLKNIKQQQQMAGAVAVVQAATEQAGVVFSAQAAVDDGDPVQGFAMQVAGKPVQGSFWKATFKEGDEVQVIGETRSGVFQAIALTKPAERMIWMQPHCERGTDASTKSVLKKASYATIFLLLLSIPMSYFLDEPLWFSLLTTATFAGLIWGVMVFWSWRDYMAFAREMNAVGAALGLPEPEKIDLFKSTKAALQAGKPDVPMGVYYY
jgi:hypothetical protein